MTERRGDRWLTVACACALGALALMTWQIFDPTVWPVMVAMSLGQVLGTASFAAFGYVVWTDYRRQRRAREASKVVEVEGARAPGGSGVESGEMPGTAGTTPRV
jgi:hypothetical protein